MANAEAPDPIDRTAVLDRFRWREDIDGQIVNTDIDGLLSAALLAEQEGWPIVGYYDTENLWITDAAAEMLRHAPEAIAWVDCDMAWPGLRSVSQHVVANRLPDLEAVVAFRSTVNPSVATARCRVPEGRYRTKYPYGTFQWLWWLYDVEVDRSSDRWAIMQGLHWMPDGGFGSIQGRHAENCIDWAVRVMPDSPLTDLARGPKPGQKAARLVSEARQWLQGQTGETTAVWRNHQLALTGTRPEGVEVFASPAHPTVGRYLSGVLEAIAKVFGWRPVRSPAGLQRYMGTWSRSAQVPDGWPTSANEGSVVSLAVTGFDAIAHTTPVARDHDVRSLAAVLPRP